MLPGQSKQGDALPRNMFEKGCGVCDPGRQRGKGTTWQGEACSDPSTFPVEQPIDLFFNGPAHMTFLHVGIKAWPIARFAI
jgi:hypothetical protein